jgi:hypothetical protein
LLATGEDTKMEHPSGFAIGFDKAQLGSAAVLRWFCSTVLLHGSESSGTMRGIRGDDIGSDQCLADNEPCYQEDEWTGFQSPCIRAGTRTILSNRPCCTKACRSLAGSPQYM